MVKVLKWVDLTWKDYYKFVENISCHQLRTCTCRMLKHVHDIYSANLCVFTSRFNDKYLKTNHSRCLHITNIQAYMNESPQLHFFHHFCFLSPSKGSSIIFLLGNPKSLGSQVVLVITKKQFSLEGKKVFLFAGALYVATEFLVSERAVLTYNCTVKYIGTANKKTLYGIF